MVNEVSPDSKEGLDPMVSPEREEDKDHLDRLDQQEHRVNGEHKVC